MWCRKYLFVDNCSAYNWINIEFQILFSTCNFFFWQKYSAISPTPYFGEIWPVLSLICWKNCSAYRRINTGSNKLQNMIYQLHVQLMMMITRLANITRMYVYVPVLKKLILVSVAWVTSQYFYSSLDGMLDFHKVTPSHPTLNLQVPN